MQCIGPVRRRRKCTANEPVAVDCRGRMTPTTLGELLHWSYANLAMAHAAVASGSSKYRRLDFMIRARLFKGLRTGSMSIVSMLDDERTKLLSTGCCYCGKQRPLSLDHMIPSIRGGSDSSDNVVWSCRPCNSSKGGRDMLQWFAQRGEFPPLLLRRYLKLALAAAEAANAMDVPLGALPELPMLPSEIPTRFPQPGELVLEVGRPGGHGAQPA